MFGRMLAAGAVGAALLAAPAVADDLGGRQALQCADRVLEWLTEQPQRPNLHVGLGTWFMGCSYYLPPVVGPILNELRADLDAIERQWEAQPDVDPDEISRYLICGAWTAIYSNTYYGLIPEYGSDAVGGLPEPDVHATACERWVEGQ